MTDMPTATFPRTATDRRALDEAAPMVFPAARPATTQCSYPGRWQQCLMAAVPGSDRCHLPHPASAS